MHIRWFWSYVRSMESIRAQRQLEQLEALSPLYMKERPARETMDRLRSKARSGQAEYYTADKPQTRLERLEVEQQMDSKLATLKMHPVWGRFISIRRAGQ